LNYVTDTHSLVWYFTDDQHLSKKALKSFESTVKEGQIIVPENAKMQDLTPNYSECEKGGEIL